MSATEQQEVLRGLVAEKLGLSKAALRPETRLDAAVGADSFAVLDLVMAIEERFGIEVPDEDVEQLRTLGDVYRYVEARAGR